MLEKDLSEEFGDVAIHMDDDAVTALIGRARHALPKHGARAVRRVFERSVMDRCLDVMDGAEGEGGSWVIDVTLTPGGDLRFKRTRPEGCGEESVDQAVTVQAEDCP